MDKPIPIYVPDAEAKLFLVFMERHEVFEAMVEADAFSVGWGKVVLNFAGGRLENVVREEVAWRRPR